ncbi:hypothetical protein GOP47_0018475 [Adiantum capillus-veneris]|uniref:Uncharacterized protein n=1 Tax=Adiantum capillus-veneris TaxID=13818 RepID=A0A9D4UEQ9_ADICA|nr:hypothetical protein GOP47_0018475 [Adiantum capillus-veneris]
MKMGEIGTGVMKGLRTVGMMETVAGVRVVKVRVVKATCDGEDRKGDGDSVDGSDEGDATDAQGEDASTDGDGEGEACEKVSMDEDSTSHLSGDGDGGTLRQRLSLRC